MIILSGGENELLENYGKIQYSFETQKYTEGTFNLNIETINFPKNKNILLFPKNSTFNLIAGPKPSNFSMKL